MAWFNKRNRAEVKPSLSKKEIEKLYSHLGFRVQKDEDGNYVPVPLQAGKGVGDDQGLSQFLDLWVSSDYTRIDDERRRLFRYESYQQMDSAMSEASMTLDAYADEVIGMGFVSNILSIQVPGNKQLEDKLKLVFEQNDLFKGVRGLVRSLCKWGDLGVRIKKVNDRIFLTQVPPNKWEAVCFPDTRSIFRYLNTDDSRKHTLSGLSASYRKKTGTEQTDNMELYEFTTFSLSDTEFYPYGRSILEPMRLAMDQLMTIEALLALTRASRVERMVMRVPTNQQEPTQAFYKIQHARSLVKSLVYSFRDKRHAYGKIPSLTDWFVYPSDEGFDLDRLAGGLDISSIEDVEYFREKVILATGLPQGYFTSEEIIDRGNALIAQDLKFARKIIPIQQALVSGLSRLCSILAVYHGEDPAATNIKVSMKLPIQVNRDLAQHWSDVMTTTGSMLDLLREFLGSPEDDDTGRPIPVVSEDTFFSVMRMLGMPEDIIAVLRTGRSKQKKINAEQEKEKEEEGGDEDEDEDDGGRRGGRFGENVRLHVSPLGDVVFSGSSRGEMQKDPMLLDSLKKFDDDKASVYVDEDGMNRLVEARLREHRRAAGRRPGQAKRKRNGMVY